LLWKTKKIRIQTEKIAEASKKIRCENWEREIMRKRTLTKINFEDNPILFLLVFCDSIQDEGRITSSENTSQQYLSELIDVTITTEGEKILTNVILKSESTEKKLKEIERVAWCLKDDRFSVFINDTLKRMDGNGGG